MWDKCPNSECKETNVRKLIAPGESKNGQLYCPSCYQINKRKNCQIGTVIDKWVSTENGKTMRLTHGKVWEIERRRMADDGKTVINIDTGKETQY